MQIECATRIAILYLWKTGIDLIFNHQINILAKIQNLVVMMFSIRRLCNPITVRYILNNHKSC